MDIDCLSAENSLPSDLISRVNKKIESSCVYDVAIESPLDFAKKLSLRTKNKVFLKREDLQPVFSFKLRGAYQKIATLSKEEKDLGIITASAGNHAQGVALAASKLGLQALIVMPQTTPSIKVDSVKNLGGTPILHGDSYDDAYDEARRLEKHHHMTFVHPYDDEEVMAGQGTIAKELLTQLSEIDYVFIPVGGGGLLGGMLSYLKTHAPHIKVIAVEVNDSACLYAALKAKKRVILPEVGIFADGVAVKQIGEKPFDIIEELLDDIILVDTDEICAAIKDIFEETRIIVEPAGALAVAGMKAYVKNYGIENKQLVCINCGANVNFDRITYISERALIGDKQEALFAVTIPEQKGSFLNFCEKIGKKFITEFNYRYSDPKNANIFVGIKLQEGQKEGLKKSLEEEFTLIDLTDNEMAKLHIRHMVGGISRISDEILYRFVFPEKPGALLKFLKQIGTHFNISLFHYRNNGSAFGRVLAGIQVPIEKRDTFILHMEQLGYIYHSETDNPAYKLFLK